MESRTMTPWKNPYQRRFFEKPLTIAKDLNEAMKVELIQSPQISGALREFVECGAMNTAPDFEDSGTVLEDLINENALWAGLETLHFTFKVTGISRHLTHQLVRQRVGITFMQQCTDSVDWRHHNILVPRAVIDYTGWVNYVLQGKMIYTKAIDTKQIPCQVARHILPHSLETFIYIHVSLATLIPMLKKRICTMCQPWETHLWAALTIKEVLRYYPMLEKALESDCEKLTCFYHRAKENPTSAYLYQPDGSHGFVFWEWNKDSYVYPYTNAVMNDRGDPHLTTYYLETTEISKDEYEIYAKELKL